MNRENINAEEALAAFNRARDAFNSQRFDEFVGAVEICESYFKAKDIDSYIMLQEMYGVFYFNRGNFVLAIERYMDAIEYAKSNARGDSAWNFIFNIAAIYISINRATPAIDYTNRAFDYLKNHPEKDDYNDCLANVYLNFAKAYLIEQPEESLAWSKKIDDECKIYDDDLILCVALYKTRLFLKLKQINEVNKNIAYIHNILIDRNGAFENIYDDLIAYAKDLLDNKLLEEFMFVYTRVSECIEKDIHVYLAKKLIILKIEYDKIIKDLDNYYIDCAAYYEYDIVMGEEDIAYKALELRDELTAEAAENERFKTENDKLIEKAQKDGLTKLNNRACFDEQVVEKFENAKRAKKTFGIEICDVDYFKQFNDNYGHQQGDECLKEVSRLLKKLEKDNEGVTAYRYGGDEFIVIYEGIEYSDLDRKIKDLRMGIHNRAMKHEFSLLPVKIVTISQGACLDIPKSNETWDMYLKKADDNLYNAKKKSKDTMAISKYRKHLLG